MALVLGCKLGAYVRIGEAMVKVNGIWAADDVELTVGDRVFKITDAERVQILPEVWVSLGRDSSSKGLYYCRLAIEAPRSIRIERVDPKQTRLHAEPQRAEVRPKPVDERRH